MQITRYRGYDLHLSEKVDIYWGRDRVDQADNTAEACERIDNWLAAP